MQEMTRISVPMTVEEREALRTLALNEMREPREHVRFLIKQAIKHQCFFSTNANDDTTGQGKNVVVAA
jgi:hypothetical protein